MLSWLQAGYTLEEIDVYGVGPSGEEVVVIHRVGEFRALGCDLFDGKAVGPGKTSAVGHLGRRLNHDKVYVGRKDNPSFGKVFYQTKRKTVIWFSVVANESLEDTAEVIWGSIGPSGPNKVSCIAPDADS